MHLVIAISFIAMLLQKIIIAYLFAQFSNSPFHTDHIEGHYQPRCPIHLGYYDLRLVDNMIEQARLAKSYGIQGFCYYFYWFDGKVLMRQPLEQMLADARVDMPFCLMWANENWTRRWDGLPRQILLPLGSLDVPPIHQARR